MLAFKCAFVNSSQTKLQYSPMHCMQQRHLYCAPCTGCITHTQRLNHVVMHSYYISEKETEALKPQPDTSYSLSDLIFFPLATDPWCGLIHILCQRWFSNESLVRSTAPAFTVHCLPVTYAGHTSECRFLHNFRCR